MKIYVYPKSVVLTGKAWEIRDKLRIASKNFYFVKDWVETVHRK